ncbi:hypothetical protein FRB96_005456 [Tulasnella sp. 330]|nr:hypothetical protein FRB96_005456 [Tulasnella sp. 330]KAG8881987.1 hypothetical protein FRB97_008855 [Tulasnella sp. 331]KAG8888325.1 hypothetical protein FRB98_007983 [Tulasnella sp. 332]
MSLTRSLFNEFRPLFSMLADKSFSRSFPSSLAASLNLKDEDGQYVLSAELPGVKKENLEVHVGDNGRSITIQGGTLLKSVPRFNSLVTQIEEEISAQSTQGSTISASQQNSRDDSSRPEVDQSNQIANAAPNTWSLQDRDGWASRLTFSRTLWLPRAVDASKVSGKLEDGILRLSMPKLDGQERLKRKVMIMVSSGELIV